MKFHKLLVFMMVFSLAVFAKSAFAQDDDDDDDDSGDMEEMDEDTWEAQMAEYTTKKTDLTNQLASLTTEVDGLKNTLDLKKESNTNAQSNLYNMVGSFTMYQEYQTKFSDCEKKVAACKGPDDAAAIETGCWEMITNFGNNGKMHCLPEFFDRYNKMKKDIATCKGKVEASGNYTVIKGDCLSKIAGMTKIYGNSKLWPAIWDANKSGVVSAPERTAKTIPNPNLIYPGQVLKIPTLTDAQKTAAMDNSSSYKSKRKKRMMKSDSNDMNEKKDMKSEKKEMTTPPTTPKK
ncbi:MAG: LysM peptidoglycan-binding domain-containing protein [bacterium]